VAGGAVRGAPRRGTLTCGVPNSGDEGGAPRPRHRRGDRSGSELQNRFAGENRFQEPDLHWHQKLFRRSPRSPSLAALSPSLPAAPYELRRAGGVPRVVKSAVLLERFVSPQRWRCRRCSSTGAGRTGRADRAGGRGPHPHGRACCCLSFLSPVFLPGTRRKGRTQRSRTRIMQVLRKGCASAVSVSHG
jgi:hypothetical protein